MYSFAHSSISKLPDFDTLLLVLLSVKIVYGFVLPLSSSSIYSYKSNLDLAFINLKYTNAPIPINNKAPPPIAP